MEYGKRGRELGGNLFEKSEIKPAAEKSGGRCLRDGGFHCFHWRDAEATGWEGQSRVTAPLISYLGHDPAKHRKA